MDRVLIEAVLSFLALVKSILTTSIKGEIAFATSFGKELSSKEDSSILYEPPSGV